MENALLAYTLGTEQVYVYRKKKCVCVCVYKRHIGTLI